ncbi:hypothetical protein ABIE45_004150 [Methylobacterium sp. OAE515]|jgi:hypothetical protein|uniref:hypothetical protein n=1 Tax=Methylobacterium sp. OAE515 TaxID=2817895 RepID=UPI00178AA552
MNGDDPQSGCDTDALDRIAHALGVPVAAFLTDKPDEAPDIATAVMAMGDPAQVVALLRLFARLKSPEARARCLAYVVQEATQDG